MNDWEAWRAAVHGVAKSWGWLNNKWIVCGFHFPEGEKVGCDGFGRWVSSLSACEPCWAHQTGPAAGREGRDR